MPTLGATLEELVSLKGRLDQSSSEIEVNNSSARTTTTTMVSTLNSQAATAKQQIESFMASLTTDVNAVYTQTSGTDWTGRNKDLFTDNYATFQTSMSSAATATNTYFDQLAGVVTTMMSDLEVFQGQLSADLDTASAASTSMGVAVQGQHDNLDAAMNTGMTFG